MTIWVVGCRGMLGTCCTNALRALGVPFVATDVDELDITDGLAVKGFAQAERCRAIINCAAYTAVDKAEVEPTLAHAVNATAVGHLAAAAVDVGAALVHVSTDYVFSGDARAPYVEDAATGPKNVYGQSKLAGEERLKQVIGGFAKPAVPAWVVRTSWLFGPAGQDFVGRMRLRLAQPEPVNMVADQHGRPTYAPDLAWALLRLAGQSDDGPAAPPGIYHFANSGACTWYELTMAIRERVANACDVRPVTTAEVPRPAKRPAYSVLDTTKYEAATGRVPTPWPLAVGRCLDVLALRERTKQER